MENHKKSAFICGNNPNIPNSKLLGSMKVLNSMFFYKEQIKNILSFSWSIRRQPMVKGNKNLVFFQ